MRAVAATAGAVSGSAALTRALGPFLSLRVPVLYGVNYKTGATTRIVNIVDGAGYPRVNTIS